jgi:hypothetical protein
VALLIRGEKAVKANADTDVVATRETTATESLMVDDTESRTLDEAGRCMSSLVSWDG